VEPTRVTALVLAGGLGTRLRERVADVPKPMAPVAGRPFLEYVLDELIRNDVPRAVLSIGHLGEAIVAHFGTSYGPMAIEYSREDRPLGTGGAIRRAVPLLAGDAVLVLNGDTSVPFDVDDLLDARVRHRTDLVLTVCGVPNVGRYGAIRAGGGTVSALVEKGTSGPGLINCGVYLVAGRLLGRVAAGPEVFSFERDVMHPWVADHGAACVATAGPFIDIGVPADYDLAADVLAPTR
jgi:D-glycero-alpha-D-manno-heptose 1-phosphate guanylyltransferase